MQTRVDLILSYTKGKILDVGYVCGTLHQQLIKKVRKRNIYGLDTETKKENNYYKKGNAEKMPYANKSFNTVVSGELIEHLKHPEKFIKESYRVLKKNGVLIITTPNKYSLINIITKSYNAKLHFNLFGKRELIKIIERNGFKVLKFQCFPYTEESNYGSKHKKLFFLRELIHPLLPQPLQEEMVVIAIK
ncbi:MAG: methyltransferase domain-containing protein [Candidatus Diapherotrites archaeon]